MGVLMDRRRMAAETWLVTRVALTLQTWAWCCVDADAMGLIAHAHICMRKYTQHTHTHKCTNTHTHARAHMQSLYSTVQDGRLEILVGTYDREVVVFAREGRRPLKYTLKARHHFAAPIYGPCTHPVTRALFLSRRHRHSHLPTLSKSSTHSLTHSLSHSLFRVRDRRCLQLRSHDTLHV